MKNFAAELLKLSKQDQNEIRNLIDFKRRLKEANEKSQK